MKGKKILPANGAVAYLRDLEVILDHVELLGQVMTATVKQKPPYRTSRLLIKPCRLDLVDQKGEIGSCKVQIRGRDAVMPDVRRDMFVMRRV